MLVDQVPGSDLVPLFFFFAFVSRHVSVKNPTFYFQILCDFVF